VQERSGRFPLRSGGLWVPAAVVTGLAGLDLAIGGRAVLVGLLVVGSMLAAAWQGPRATAAVGVYTVGVSVLLGAPDNIWGTADHLLRSVGITAGAALAVWLAGQRVGREAGWPRWREWPKRRSAPSLRPPPPTLGELRIAARYRSAASASLVGDMFEVVDTDWGVRALVGDVWSATSFVDPKRTCVRHAQTARSGVLRSDEWSALALEANESAPGLALSPLAPCCVLHRLGRSGNVRRPCACAPRPDALSRHGRDTGADGGRLRRRGRGPLS
jgi:hypothetical protein